MITTEEWMDLLSYRQMPAEARRPSRQSRRYFWAETSILMAPPLVSSTRAFQ